MRASACGSPKSGTPSGWAAPSSWATRRSRLPRRQRRQCKRTIAFPRRGPSCCAPSGGNRSAGMRDRKIVLVVIAVVLIAAVGFLVYRRSTQKRQAAQRDQAQAAARVIPVVAAPVQRRDIPIYLDGLGNVTAFKTVTVRSQVDGLLEQVLFREGQPVKAGELLARID